MRLHKNSIGETYHFVIFDRETDEEGVLTFTKLLISINVRVTLFLSEKLYALIGDELKKHEVEVYILQKDLSSSLQLVNEFLQVNTVDLIHFPYFDAVSFKEVSLYIKFLKKQTVFAHINSYQRWIATIPPYLFKLGRIRDWFFCKLAFKYFSGYIISEPHVNSDNPLKQILQKKTKKEIFEIPFKIMESSYNPSITYNFPCFVIPGGIERSRRDYFSVLDILTSKQLINKNWKLILLGRPVGNYGQEIIKFCQNANYRLGKEKFIFFDHYINKELFDHFMELSNFIIAPINPKGYSYGKDSGALYDVFHYNKFGIFNNRYFYTKTLPETKCLLTYNSKQDLSEILSIIIDNKFDPTTIYKNIDEINTLFGKDYYLRYLKNKINELFQQLNYQG